MKCARLAVGYAKMATDEHKTCQQNFFDSSQLATKSDAFLSTNKTCCL